MSGSTNASYIVYTDGSFKTITRGVKTYDVGAYGYVVLQKQKIIHRISGVDYGEPTRVPKITNARMELIAIIRSFDELPEGSSVKIISDSSYAVNSISSWLRVWARNGWIGSQGQPVANQDLLKEIYALKQRYKVKASWVRGHNGDPHNELAHNLAYGALQHKIKQLLGGGA